MRDPNKRVAILSPIAWRTPPRQYGAWEMVASNVTEGLVSRGWNVTLFASGDSVTSAHLHAIVDQGYEEDSAIDSKVAEYLHISEAFEHAAEFDLIHSHYDFMPLSYTRLIKTPVLTTIHGFSSAKIMPIYQKYRDGYFVSVSDSDRAPGLNYLATVYNGIDLSLYPLQDSAGNDLVFLGRIHPDKGVHLAIEVARLSGKRLIIAGIVQDKAYFREQIQPHLDDQNIIYIGPVDVEGKNELFARARVLLHLNTIPERFGLWPFLTPNPDGPFAAYEEFGVEDPRVTRMDGEYIITYSAYSRNGVRIALAKTKDFTRVERISLITEADYRNVVIFSEKFDGLYDDLRAGRISFRKKTNENL